MTKLITAEEWRQHSSAINYYGWVQAIQTNAAKWGMEQAAAIVNGFEHRVAYQRIMDSAGKLEMPKD